MKNHEKFMRSELQIFFYPHQDNRREVVAKYSNDTYFK
jgi:hypothetical protein